MWTDRRKEGWNVLACFVIVYGTSVVLFFPASRYRLPIVPPLLIFAVAGGAELVSAWKSSRRRMSYGLAAMVGVGCLIALPARFPTDHVTFAAELHNDVGVSLQREHQYTASLMHLLRAAKADPSNSVVHSNLACVMARLEDYGRAKFSCRRALQARPDYVDALAMLGGVLCTEREFAEAETCYRQWTRLNPSDGVSWNNLGFSLLWQRRYAEALDCLATALRVAGPHAKVMVNLGETLMGLGRFQEAVRCFRKALSLEPDNAEIRRELDMAALKIKDGGSRF
jgi:Tfp pilus assembly protein PilF